MSRIVIDGRMLYWTGVGRYTKALLEQLEQLDRDNEYVVLTRPADRALWAPRAENFRRVEVDIDPYTAAEQLRLPGVLRGLKPDLVHFTAANAPVFYVGRRVVTVHDLTLLDYDTSRGSGPRQALRRLKRPLFAWVVRRNVARAERIMTPSVYVKDQLVERLGAKPQQVTVTPLAADKDMAAPAPIDKFSPGNQFLLYVGNSYPYKLGNEVVLEALKLLAPKFPELRFVTTSKPDFFRDQWEHRARDLGVADRLVFTGFVSDGELVSLFRQAKLYVYPSLSEGFGLQILESMAQGLPVVAARTSSLPEVGGSAAAYFDPHNPAELADLIWGLLDDEGERKRMSEAGLERAKQFTWARMAKQALEVYSKALK